MDFCPHCLGKITKRLVDEPPPGMEFMPAPFNAPVAYTLDRKPLYDPAIAFRSRKRRSVVHTVRDWARDEQMLEAMQEDY